MSGSSSETPSAAPNRCQNEFSTKELKMRESNRLDDLIEWLQGNRSRIDLVSAVAAGAGLSLMGIMLLNVSYLRTVNPLDYIDVAKLVLIATIPYLIATLIIRWLWSMQLRRILPPWIVIACLGLY
jgi:hypothetical protein